MMLLCYHGMVPLQHLCDIGAVTVRFLRFHKTFHERRNKNYFKSRLNYSHCEVGARDVIVTLQFSRSYNLII